MFAHCDITKDLSRAKKFFENIVSYTVGPYTLSDILEQKQDSINIIDVREYNDYLDGHLPYAMHIQYKEIKEHLGILDKNKVTVVYTYNDSCPRAYNTALELVEHHYPSVILRGGYKMWKKSDLDTTKSNSQDYPEHD
ncbi:rhodanese-like domain-containing protein [bacterium]|nr:rhodanese-like domain-containing protein [bacterium]